jgi:Ca-activated chloride channel family protein
MYGIQTSLHSTKLSMKRTNIHFWLCYCIALTLYSCGNDGPKNYNQIITQNEKVVTIEVPEEEPMFEDQSIEEEIVIEVPRTAEPPPPPPIIEEVPEEEVLPQHIEFQPLAENQFQNALDQPLSTFSIDVDRASYSIIRRYLNSGQLPPQYAVRLEECVNYFKYDYPQPDGKVPFTVYNEMTDCPWQKDHKLLMVGMQGKNLPIEKVPPSNLVFLIDVSGSMSDYNKLDLLKKAFRLLVHQLRPDDRVAIVVYAGASGVVLESTPGHKKEKILGVLNHLEAGGSTAGAEGIELAYQIAEKYFLKRGNNRIILATDGDFNVGPSSQEALIRLIEQKRDKDIFLSVLGFGMGNYQDNKMEQLADHGNGNYAYIDNILEAKKVLVNEFAGTLYTIAKDVKIQIEFNPAHVQSYRLLGYENRILNKEDFNNDRIDAGEIGAGHNVTALYEIVPQGMKKKQNDSVDPLKYQQKVLTQGSKEAEWMTIKLRYKEPKGKTSKLLSYTGKDLGIPFASASQNLRFSAAVSSFAMLLRESQYAGQSNFNDIIEWAKNAKGEDDNGERAEFIRLAETAQSLHLTKPK